MSLSTRCKGCDREFTAETEDDLVEQVHAHILEAHAHGHSPTRDQVRAVIRDRWAREQR